MSSIEWAGVVALFPIGGLFGGLLGGRLCKSLGRRRTILYNTIVVILASALMALSINVWMLGLGRFIVGFASGIYTSAVPMYVSEISPTRYRGTFGALNQLSIVVAILVSQALGVPLSTVEGWRWLFAASIVPAAIQALTLPFSMDSPNFLVSRGRIDEAENSLKRLRGSQYVSEELESIVNAQNATRNQASMGIGELVMSVKLRKTLIIALGAQLAQQLCGINGVMQYSSTIFQVSFPEIDKQLTVGVGVINLIMTLISVYLMDRAGRRKLLLWSQFSMIAFSVLITVTFETGLNVLATILVALFVAAFAIGLGPIPWLLLPEIFPTYAVGAASSVCVATNWLSNFLVSLAFDPMFKAIGSYTFLPFAGISLLLGFMMAAMLPETKGRSLEEIVQILQ